MFLEQGNDPGIGQEPMIVLQLVQYSYQPVSNIFFPPGPYALGTGYPFHEFGLLDHQSTRLVDLRQLECEGSQSCTVCLFCIIHFLCFP